MAPATVLKRFNPPGFLKDIQDEKLLQGWSDVLSGWMDDEIAGGDGSNRPITPLSRFFNGTKTAYDQTAAQVPITWIAFPKSVSVGGDEKRWKTADSDKNFQDEYLEWSMQKDSQGHIVSVTYTCEGPEYWEYLGMVQPEKTFQLIKELNAPLLDNSKMEDFFVKDKKGAWQYNRRNKYNSSTTGGTIINLYQRNNTLGAEVDIAAQGTVIRQTADGKIITDNDQLIRCSQYGSAKRNSDPVIGGKINALARSGLSISVADPVALYIHTFKTDSLFIDTSGSRDGTTTEPLPKSWITLQRGSALNGKTPFGLRLRIRNEDGRKTDDGSRKLDVSDIWDDSKSTNIRYGAQFTDYITMGVSGVAGTKGPPPTVADALFCLPEEDAAAAFGVGNGVAAEEDGAEVEAPTFKIRPRSAR